MTDIEARNNVIRCLTALTDAENDPSEAEKAKDALFEHAEKWAEVIDLSLREYFSANNSPESNAIANLYAMVGILPIISEIMEQSKLIDQLSYIAHRNAARK